MILRVLHYNPFSANQLRLEEILRATRNFSIVGLVATQLRAPVGLVIGSVEAGWARAPLSNKSAGIHIALRKPCTPPPSMQGRALAARLKGGFFDLFCLLHVSSSQTTNWVEKRRVSEDCGTSVGIGWMAVQVSKDTAPPLVSSWMPMMESVLSSVLADIVLSTVSALRLHEHVANT